MTVLEKIKYHLELAQEHAKEAAKLTATLSDGGNATKPPSTRKARIDEIRKSVIDSFAKKFKEK